jgi:hypothetical protein
MDLYIEFFITNVQIIPTPIFEREKAEGPKQEIIRKGLERKIEGIIGNNNRNNNRK